MIITYYLHHLFIIVTIVQFSNCNWLRLGITNIELPEQDYIVQFNRMTVSSRNQNRKMIPINNTVIHQHRINRKLSTKYLNHTIEDLFLNNNNYSNKTKSIQINQKYDSLLGQLSALQLKFIKINSNTLKVIISGIHTAIEQCALRFENERWNCSIEDENEVFGQTLKQANRETAFVQSIISAGITYSLTKACSKGNLENCACNNRYERYSDVGESKRDQRVWHWAGCSDNLAFGVKLAKKFIDNSITVDKRKDHARRSIRESMYLHNSRAGREAIKKLMKLECRCHGYSSSCQMKTCWRSLPKFDEIGKYLKKQYQKAVRIEGTVNQGVNSLLKRSRRSFDEQFAIKRSTDGSSSDYKSKQQQKKLSLSAQYSQVPVIELQINSLVANKIESSASEKEIDQDSDYEDEEEEPSNDEEPNSRLIIKTNRVINLQQFNDKKLNSRTVLDAGSSDGSNGFKDSKEINRKSKLNNNIEKNSIRLNDDETKITTKKTTTKKQKNQQVDRNEHSKVISKQIDDINLQFINIMTNSQRTINQAIKPSKSTLIDSKNQWSPAKQDLVYIHKSPNYCLANDNLKILGTRNRTCRKTNKRNSSGSCELLCCGRGYDRRIVRKNESCRCEFDVTTVQVKCSTCESIKEILTCK